MACCPFHHEKTPSFSVSPKKQMYHCFGCHVSGDVISFMMEQDGLSFVEAVEELAAAQGFTVPYEKNGYDQKDDGKIKFYYDALNAAAKFYRWSLKYDANRQKAIAYLKHRGIDSKTASFFQIGYAPDAWRGLYDVLERSFSEEILESCGLVIKNADKQHAYDRFRDRLIFPIRNRQGQVIGFGARILEEDRKQPKYINSPESAIFHKGQELYGLYELKFLKALKRIVVVEGYMDVIGLFTHGFYGAVAALGTAFSEDHARLLFRRCHNIVLCFDGDNAGRQAAIRAFKVILPKLDANKKARFLMLPHEHDPDSYIKEYGLAAFDNMVDKAEPAVDFFLEFLKADREPGSADSLAKLLETARIILSDLPQTPYTVSLVEYLAADLGLSSAMLLKMLFSQSASTALPVETQKWRLDINRLNFSEKALSYILSLPGVIAEYFGKTVWPDFAIETLNEKYIIFLEASNIIRQNDGLTSAGLVERLVEKYPLYRSYFFQLASLPSELDEQAILDEFLAAIDKIQAEARHGELSALIEKSKNIILSENEKKRMLEILYTVKKND